jgi:hypothetical protein
MSRSPLPVRILIPVANPLTAEELIKLGSAILDKRAGELTALGIVEVPEGMPLSEGATRARHARRHRRVDLLFQHHSFLRHGCHFLLDRHVLVISEFNGCNHLRRNPAQSVIGQALVA